MIKSNYQQKKISKKSNNQESSKAYESDINKVLLSNHEPQDDKNNIFKDTLRPQSLDEIIGRKDEKALIKKMVQSARSRGACVDHILFYGPPGLGKTSFASVIAKEMGANITITNGSVIEKVGDLAAILTSLNNKDILFVDEIHRLRPVIEEVLYPAMEDKVVDVLIGKGPSAKTLRLEIEDFTLIGATTLPARISAPLRDRFGAVVRLDYYNSDELVKIVYQKAKILRIDISESAAILLAERARMTPRIAIRLLKLARDFSFEKGQTHSEITVDGVREMLDTLKIYEFGLDQTDMRILESLGVKLDNSPTGIKTLAAMVGEDVNTIESVNEPFLLKIGFIKKTSQGRMLTAAGVEFIENKFNMN